jgi:hypothetical protein
MANKTISLASLPAATGFGPGDSLVGINNGNAALFPYNTINTGEQAQELQDLPVHKEPLELRDHRELPDQQEVEED